MYGRNEFANINENQRKNQQTYILTKKMQILVVHFICKKSSKTMFENNKAEFRQKLNGKNGEKALKGTFAFQQQNHSSIK